MSIWNLRRQNENSLWPSLPRHCKPEDIHHCCVDSWGCWAWQHLCTSVEGHTVCIKQVLCFSELNGFLTFSAGLPWQFIGLCLLFYNYAWYSGRDICLFNAFSVKFLLSIWLFVINDMEMADPPWSVVFERKRSLLGISEGLYGPVEHHVFNAVPKSC